MSKRLAFATAVVVGLAAPSAAGAGTIGVGFGSGPGLAMDAAGTAYIAWSDTNNPAGLQFCRLPRGATACDIQHAITAPGTTAHRAFVTVSGPRVAVVQYRYPLAGAEAAGMYAFISADGGATFDAGRRVGTIPFFEAVEGPGDSISGVTDANSGGGLFQNVAANGTGFASGSAQLFGIDQPYRGTVGMIDATTPLVLFTTGGDEARWRRYDGSGDVNDVANWTAASTPSGDVVAYPKLAGGPLGLFLLASAADKSVYARKFNGTSFGPAATIASGADAPTLHAFQDAAGRLHAVFARGDATGLNLAYASSDDGTAWSSSTVETQSPPIGIAETRVATAPDHVGVAVYRAGNPTGEIRVDTVPPSVPPAASLVDCEPVKVEDQHGKGMIPGCQLAKIVNDKVLCVHMEKEKTRRCSFRTGRHSSGEWLEGVQRGAHADYAMGGQAITRKGKRGGAWVVASKATDDGGIPCKKGSPEDSPKRDSHGPKRDSPSVASDTPLPGGGVLEVSASTTNRVQPLKNFATREVCTNSATHPDGAALSSHPSESVWCFTGKGAGLNDSNGMERQAPADGGYYSELQYRHFVLFNNAVAAAAKRPATKPDGTVLTNTPIAWRVVAPKAKIAN